MICGPGNSPSLGTLSLSISGPSIGGQAILTSLPGFVGRVDCSDLERLALGCSDLKEIPEFRRTDQTWTVGCVPALDFANDGLQFVVREFPELCPIDRVSERFRREAVPPETPLTLRDGVGARCYAAESSRQRPSEQVRVDKQPEPTASLSKAYKLRQTDCSG